MTMAGKQMAKGKLEVGLEEWLVRDVCCGLVLGFFPQSSEQLGAVRLAIG